MASQRRSEQRPDRAMQILLALFVTSTIGLTSAAARSDDSQNLNEAILEILYQDGTISKARYRELLDLDHSKTQATEIPEDSQEPSPAETTLKEKEAAPAPKAGPKFKVETGWNGLRVTSDDGAYEFRVGGRIQADFAVYAGGPVPMGNGTELRRARLKAQGKLMSDWEYKLEVNFDTDTQTSITDAWISYKGLRPGGVPINLTAGHLKVPFSQQSMSSSNWQVFQERALIDAFIDNPDFGRRRLGGIIESYGNHWFAALGLYSEGFQPRSRIAQNNESFGVAARLGFVPFNEERRLLSINGAVYYRGFDADAGLRFRSRPESHVTGVRLVDTGITRTAPDEILYNVRNLSDTLLYNMSITGLIGSFHAQAEYTGALVKRRGPQTDLNFGGVYVQAGYFLTGENRRYDARYGKYGRVKPNRNFTLGGGPGAWEVAARFSQISLQNEDIAGGREYDVTLALNWYVNPSIMFRLNYVAAMPHPTTVRLGSSDAMVNVFEGRMQVVF
ncbi:MAG: porin [Myxococcota bacterium]|nr:porin [Myxococcota bacterium]